MHLKYSINQITRQEELTKYSHISLALNVIILPSQVYGGLSQAYARYYKTKKNQAEAWFFMFALPIFTVRGSDASAAGGGWSELSEWQRSKFRERSANRKFRAPQQDPIVLTRQVSGGHLQAEKSPNLSVEALCLRYLVSRLGQLSFAVKKHAGGMFQAKKKEPSFRLTLRCLRYLVLRLGQSIVLP